MAYERNRVTIATKCQANVIKRRKINVILIYIIKK